MEHPPRAWSALPLGEADVILSTSRLLEVDPMDCVCNERTAYLESSSQTEDTVVGFLLGEAL